MGFIIINKREEKVLQEHNEGRKEGKTHLR
jgi:hypothetical protein